jgi:hypothetical protein
LVLTVDEGLEPVPRQQCQRFQGSKYFPNTESTQNNQLKLHGAGGSVLTDMSTTMKEIC